VLGICNGFQIACEAGLLPGALLRNASLQFVSAPVHLRVENADTLFSSAYEQGDVIRVPIAHGDGRYTASDKELDTLENDGRVVFRYVDASGQLYDAANPNGSARSIAGIVNAEGNVLGLMPHPERALDDMLGSHDGLGVFESSLSKVAA
jgi:phosphoribosylformylglycinamidine synthase